MRAFLQRDEGGDRLSFDLVRPSDDGRFGDTRMIDERALHFHRADAMPGDVQDVVHAAEQPEEAVRVALGAIASEVHVGRPAAPVLRHVSLRVAVDAAQHRRPGPREGEQAAARALDVLALLGLDLRRDAGKRTRR